MNKSLKGFTLVELIVVVGVMGILSLILTDTLIQTLRGENKVKILNQVKENGQVTLDKLANEIRQADKVVCIGKKNGAGISDTIVIFKQGKFERFRLILPNEGALSKENGYFSRYEFTLDDIANDVPDDNLCTVHPDAFPDKISYLTDRDLTKGISVDYDVVDTQQQPVFSKIVQSGFRDIVEIRFRVAQAIQAGEAYESTVEEGGILFQTSVQVRGGK